MRLILTALLLCLSSGLFAQVYTDLLQINEKGKGRVVIYQDDEIRRLVNNLSGLDKSVRQQTPTRQTPTPSRQDTVVISTPVQNTMPQELLNVPKKKMAGYRIQIYSGGNSRQDRATAQRLGATAKIYYPELSVYTNFIAPRWVCRIGDFRTQAEAQAYLSKLRASGDFNQSMIVKSTILVPEY